MLFDVIIQRRVKCKRVFCYVKGCNNYGDFIRRNELLTNKLKSNYTGKKLVKVRKKLYDRLHNIVNDYDVCPLHS